MVNLRDGGRGDDDLLQDGVITDIGGPAIAIIGASPLTVTTTGDHGVGSLRQAIVYANGLVGTTSTITFVLPAGPQTIDLLTPLPAVLNPLIVDVAATQNVVIDASTVGDLNSFSSVTKTGDGTLAFDEAAPSTATSRSTADRCSLTRKTRRPSPTAQAPSVTGAGTLELAGTTSNLTSAVNITNSSTAAAGILVSGSNQIVGAIDGDGNLEIASGGDLTANSIIQNTLTIGAGATLTIAPSGGSMEVSMAASAGSTANVAADSNLSQAIAARLAAVRAQRLARLLAANSITALSRPLHSTW